jgi:hypothetical protein
VFILKACDNMVLEARKNCLLGGYLQQIALGKTPFY